jgi:hypothetical protein
MADSASRSNPTGSARSNSDSGDDGAAIHGSSSLSLSDLANRQGSPQPSAAATGSTSSGGAAATGAKAGATAAGGSADTSSPTFGPPSLSFRPGVNQVAVSDLSKQVLSNALQRANENGASITSTTRDALGQANAMYNNESSGHHINYTSPGQAVMDVYRDSRNQGLNRDQTVPQMVNEINNQTSQFGPQSVSRHMGDTQSLNVIDISPRSLRDWRQFVRELRSDPRVRRVIDPSRGDPAVHVEINQTQDSTPLP